MSHISCEGFGCVAIQWQAARSSASTSPGSGGRTLFGVGGCESIHGASRWALLKGSFHVVLPASGRRGPIFYMRVHRSVAGTCSAAAAAASSMRTRLGNFIVAIAATARRQHWLRGCAMRQRSNGGMDSVRRSETQFCTQIPDRVHIHQVDQTTAAAGAVDEEGTGGSGWHSRERGNTKSAPTVGRRRRRRNWRRRL